jgi:hypothetical protein
MKKGTGQNLWRIHKATEVSLVKFQESVYSSNLKSLLVIRQVVFPSNFTLIPTRYLKKYANAIEVNNRYHFIKKKGRITPIKSNTEPVHFKLNKQLKVMRWLHLSKTLSFF